MLEACATVLLFCLTELCDGTSRVWKWHLKAARTLLTSVGVDFLETTPGGKFCLRLFNYLDSMSTIARCKPPLSQDGKGLAELTATTTPTMTSCSDSIAGMVNLLAAYRNRRVDELSEIGFRTAATHVRAQLDTWRASYDAAHQEHDVEEGTWDSNANLATIAFEWAIRLRLHQIVDGYSQSHAAVETAISRIMEAVLAIPYGSSVEGILLFPLVIAGASSADVERRMLVKERLMVMENTVGFGHIPRARELLETVWAEDYECNWAKVRYRQFPGVVFI